MRKLILNLSLVASFMCCLTSVQAQKFSAVPVSAGDIAYYPQEAPFKGTPAMIRIDYARPLKKGREIFGKVLKFGEVWRAGANNQTQVHFFKDVKIGETSVPAGTYSLFVVPTANDWTLVINKQTDRWGAYSYDKALDVVRLTVPVTKPAAPIEAFSITMAPLATGANLIMGWDNSLAEFPVKF